MSPDVHDTPVISSTDRMHVMDRGCWCKPEVWRQPSGDDLIVHNEATWDDECAEFGCAGQETDA